MGWGSEVRAILTAVIGAAILVVVGGILASTTGLVFVAGVTSALVGLIAAGSLRRKAWVRRFAIIVAVLAVVIGAAGSWGVALAEGGNLGLLDFLWATTGVLVPFEILVAAVAAAWGAGAGPIRP